MSTELAGKKALVVGASGGMGSDIAVALGQEGIAYVDLTPRFRDASAKKVLYLRWDPHWNLEGNKLAASILFEELAPIVDRRLRQISR